jgi:signal peptidase II
MAISKRVGVGRWVLFWSIALGGAGFDLATKQAVFNRVGYPAETVPILDHVLEIQTARNPGALWGFGRDYSHSSLFFAGLSVAAAVVIVVWLFVLGAAVNLPLTVALGLIMAGALGNCHDRIVYGYVRDFVHFHVDAIGFDCAIFNFADNMLIAGAVTLVLYALRPDADSPAPPLGAAAGPPLRAAGGAEESSSAC